MEAHINTDPAPLHHTHTHTQNIEQNTYNLTFHSISRLYNIQLSQFTFGKAWPEVIGNPVTLNGIIRAHMYVPYLQQHSTPIVVASPRRTWCSTVFDQTLLFSGTPLISWSIWIGTIRHCWCLAVAVPLSKPLKMYSLCLPQHWALLTFLCIWLAFFYVNIDVHRLAFRQQIWWAAYVLCCHQFGSWQVWYFTARRCFVRTLLLFTPVPFLFSLYCIA